MGIRINILIVLVLGLAGSAPGASAQVAVVAHPSVPIDKIDEALLEGVYRGDILFWKGGMEVVVFNLKSKGALKEVQDAFYGYLGYKPREIRRIWMRKKLSGEGDPPKSFGTEEEVLQQVISRPGSIGFVRKSVVGGDVNLKILLEIDHSEGEPL